MRLLRPITFAQAPCAAATPQTHTRGAPAMRSRELATRSLVPAFETCLHLLPGDREAQATFRHRGMLPPSPGPSETPKRCEKIGPETGHRATQREATRAHSRRADPGRGHRARNRRRIPMPALPESRGTHSTPEAT